MSTYRYCAFRGKGNYDHLFGGNRWKIKDAPGKEGALVFLTLDLKDPRLKPLAENPEITRIPVVFNPNLMVEEEIFGFDSKALSIEWKSHVLTDDEWRPDEDFVVKSIEERPIDLKTLNKSEEEDLETFVGGPHFLRILGTPPWTQGDLHPECSCGKSMDHVASLGYESGSKDFSIDKHNDGFFVGELAIYSFVCLNCSIVKTCVQSS